MGNPNFNDSSRCFIFNWIFNMKRVIIFQFTIEGHCIAEITKKYKKMTNLEKERLKKELFIFAKRIKIK